MFKRQTKYNPQWEKEYPWIQESQDDNFSANCKICRKTFSVSGGLVKQHEKTKLHDSRTQESRNQLTFQKGSDNVVELDKTTIQFSDEEILTRAEIMQGLKCVDANWSFQSANDEGKRFAILFPKLPVAKHFTLNKTKMKYTIQFGIAPHFKELLKTDLKSTAFTFKKKAMNELKQCLLHKTSTRKELQRAQSKIETGMKRRQELTADQKGLNKRMRELEVGQRSSSN